MKNKILSITAATCLFASVASAQREVAQFQINQQHFVVATNFSANKPLEFFSSVRGGKHLITSLTSSNGSLCQNFAEDETPAFVLNHKTPNHPTGDNKVYKLPPNEFVAGNIQFDLSAGNALVSWDAQINEGNSISFQILKSIDHGPFQQIHNVIGTDDNNMNTFSFTDTYQGDTRYLLQIMKNGTILRYAKSSQSQNMMLKSSSPKESFKVYPTLFQADITIDIPSMNLPVTASVCDIHGSLIKQITLFETSNTLSLNNCAKGNYILQLHGKELDQTIKLSKN